MKALRTAATVVASVAQVVAVVASFVPGGQPVAAVAQTVALAAGAVAAVSSFLMRRPENLGGGSQTDFKADPQAGIPYVIGRTFVGGNIVHHDSFGSSRKYQAFVIVWSGGGPVQEIEAFKADKQTVPFRANGEAASGYYSDDGANDTMMWLDTQLGAAPEATALTSFLGALPGWGAGSKLSGYAAGLWQLRYDIKGKRNYNNGVPKPGAIIKGVKVYDPRLDSTYPGGAGACRAGDEATYVYSENPWLHALTWAIGRTQNGKRILGIGMPTAGIDVAAYVEAANVADANGWKVGGQIYSTEDKWDRLKAMAQAGGGVPMRLSALLSCMVNAPRVSLATITSKDLIGEGRNVTTQPRRHRINGVIPRYRSEAHDWEMVPASVVRATQWVEVDGGERTQEIEFPLVQDVHQAAKLAAYEIVNAREMGPITLVLKTKWMGYRPGDCLTVDIPELGLNNQPCIVLTRQIDPSTGAVTLELKSETPGKHAFALGQVGVAPPVPDTAPPSDADDLALQNKVSAADFAALISTSSQVGLSVSATHDTITLSGHARRYNDKDVAVDGGAISGLAAATSYYLYYDDPERAGGPVAYAATTTYFDAFVSSANINRHYAGYVQTAATAGDPDTSGGGSLPPGGGGANPYEAEHVEYDGGGVIP